jgi:hypothetical protein
VVKPSKLRAKMAANIVFVAFAVARKLQHDTTIAKRKRQMSPSGVADANVVSRELANNIASRRVY